MRAKNNLLTRIAYSLLVVLISVLPTFAQDRTAKLDKALRSAMEADTDSRLRVIVRMSPGGRGAVRSELHQNGHRIVAEHPRTNAITLEVPVNALGGLARNPNVTSISIDAELKASQASVGSSNS